MIFTHRGIYKFIYNITVQLEKLSVFPCSSLCCWFSVADKPLLSSLSLFLQF